jgi:hypothetical protein
VRSSLASDAVVAGLSPTLFNRVPHTAQHDSKNGRVWWRRLSLTSLILLNEGPLPGIGEAWNVVTGYRFRLARETRQLEKAARLQSASINWNRQRAEPILAKAVQTWDAKEKNEIRNLAVSLHEVSELRREQGSASCLDGYREALSLAESIQDSQLASHCAFNLGKSYQNLAEIRDLVLSAQWYQSALKLKTSGDRIGRAQCLIQVGNVAGLRLREARNAGRSPEECGGHFLGDITVANTSPAVTAFFDPCQAAVRLRSRSTRPMRYASIDGVL